MQSDDKKMQINQGTVLNPENKDKFCNEELSKTNIGSVLNQNNVKNLGTINEFDYEEDEIEPLSQSSQNLNDGFDVTMIIPTFKEIPEEVDKKTKKAKKEKKEKKSKKTTEKTKEKKPKNNKKIGIMFIFVVVVIISLIGLYKFYYNKPYNLVVNSFNTISKSYENLYESYVIDFEEDKSILYLENVLTVNVKEDSTKSIEKFNNLALNLNMTIDYQNDRMLLETSVVEEDKEIFNIDLEYLENMIYMNLGNLFESTMIINAVEDLDLGTVKELELKELTRIILDGYIKTIDQNNYIIEEVEIDYFGDTIDVRKTTFVYDEAAYNRLIEYIVSQDNLIELLEDITGESEESIIEAFTTGEVFKYAEGILNLSVYNKGILDTFVGMELFDGLIVFLKNGKEYQITIKDFFYNKDLVIDLEKEKNVLRYNTDLNTDTTRIHGEISDNYCSIINENENFTISLLLENLETKKESLKQRITLAVVAEEDGEKIDLEVVLNNNTSLLTDYTEMPKNEAIQLEEISDNVFKEIYLRIVGNIEGTVFEGLLTEEDVEEKFLDHQKFFVEDIEKIIISLEEKIKEDESKGIYLDCYRVDELIYFGYVEDIHYSYFGSINVDRSLTQYEYNLMIGSSYRGYTVSNYKYKLGTTIYPFFIQQYDSNIDINSFYTCS